MNDAQAEALHHEALVAAIAYCEREGIERDSSGRCDATDDFVTGYKDGVRAERSRPLTDEQRKKIYDIYWNVGCNDVIDAIAKALGKEEAPHG